MVAVVALPIMMLMCFGSPFVFPRDYFVGHPYIKLPQMSNAGSYCDRFDDYEIVTISWSPSCKWMIQGVGSVERSELECQLLNQRDMALENGKRLWVRIRIPADAPADKFLSIIDTLMKLGDSRLSLVGVVAKRV